MGARAGINRAPASSARAAHVSASARPPPPTRARRTPAPRRSITSRAGRGRRLPRDDAPKPPAPLEQVQAPWSRRCVPASDDAHRLDTATRAPGAQPPAAGRPRPCARRSGSRKRRAAPARQAGRHVGEQAPIRPHAASAAPSPVCRRNRRRPSPPRKAGPRRARTWRGTHRARPEWASSARGRHRSTSLAVGAERLTEGSHRRRRQVSRRRITAFLDDRRSFRRHRSRRPHDYLHGRLRRPSVKSSPGLMKRSRSSGYCLS